MKLLNRKLNLARTKYNEKRKTTKSSSFFSFVRRRNSVNQSSSKMNRNDASTGSIEDVKEDGRDDIRRRDTALPPKQAVEDQVPNQSSSKMTRSDASTEGIQEELQIGRNNSTTGKEEENNSTTGKEDGRDDIEKSISVLAESVVQAIESEDEKSKYISVLAESVVQAIESEDENSNATGLAIAKSSNSLFSPTWLIHRNDTMTSLNTIDDPTRDGWLTCYDGIFACCFTNISRNTPGLFQQHSMGSFFEQSVESARCGADILVDEISYLPPSENKNPVDDEIGPDENVEIDLTQEQRD